MSRQHIHEELMDRYAMGSLVGETLAEVEEHLLECALCQVRLTEVDEFLAVFRAAAVQADARPARRERRQLWAFGRTTWASLAAAAALLAIVVAPKHSSPEQPALTVDMRSLRGPEAAAHSASGKNMLMIFDVIPRAGEADYEVELVDSGGGEVAKAGTVLKDGRLTATVGKLAHGSYWVRVYVRRPVRDLLGEYGLKIE
jgi:hypothetical protein